MRGGAFFNGKEGRVDFRKNLRFKGRLVGFRRKNLSSQETTFIFSNVKKVLLGFRKTSLNAKEVFRKPFLSPIS